MRIEDNPIVVKSFAFAMRIIKLYRYLVEEHKEYTLSRELLISGTHIGKHVKQAISGESSETFVTQMATALRKSSETEYWLQLILFAGYINEKEFESVDATALRFPRC